MLHFVHRESELRFSTEAKKTTTKITGFCNNKKLAGGQQLSICNHSQGVKPSVIERQAHGRRIVGLPYIPTSISLTVEAVLSKSVSRPLIWSTSCCLYFFIVL